jgi:hypothetical protein
MCCLIDRFIFHINRTDKKKRKEETSTHIYRKKNEQENFYMTICIYVRQHREKQTHTVELSPAIVE